MSGGYRRRALAVALVLSVQLGGCAGGHAPTFGSLRGVRLEVVGGWSGVEQRHFEAVLQGFARASGASVRYTLARGYLPRFLDGRLRRHRPPDVALLPQPGLLRRFARAGRLVPLDDETAGDVRRAYGRVWRGLASVSGREYGVWLKAANKSLIWYDVASFERAGIVPPDDLNGLFRLPSALARRGAVAFGVGARDAWTLTDWFENLYLRTAGPRRYDELTQHRIPWTDRSVGRALELLRRLLAPRFLLGGTKEALALTFEQSVARAFSNPARAAMVFEGDFVAGALAERTHARLGADVDVFPFPGAYRGLPVVVGGGDVAVQMKRSPAATELMRYFSSAGAAAIWAKAGGFISPNLDLDLRTYRDPITRSAARAVIEAGDGFRFDLSDLQPAAFGADPNAGMQAGLRSFLVDRNVAATQRRLESDADAAFGR